MKRFPILYWPDKTTGNADYKLARKVISQETGIMPEVVSGDIDLSNILSKDSDQILYFPVFYGYTGWWGEFLGTDAKIIGKLIISSECQLMLVKLGASPKRGGNHLLAAEIYPSSGFFKKMNSSIATISDMLATDSGTVIALFSGKSQTKFVSILESTGNSYLGCIGQY